MRSNILLLLFLIVAAFLTSCDRLMDKPEQSVTLQYLTTELGGCNGQIFDRKILFQELENDTIYNWLSGDTLNFFIGINYTCCAPFATDYNIGQDTITMKLLDACPAPYECYCRCMCYYTFRFQLGQYNGWNLNYKVILYNPVKENPIILFSGKIKN